LVLGLAVLISFSLPESAAAQACLDCHSDNTLVKLIHQAKKFAFCKRFSVCIIGSRRNGLRQLPYRYCRNSHAEDLPEVDCSQCHSTETETYQWHGRLKVGVGEDIPKCSDCHGTHDIKPSSNKLSKTNPLNLPATCGDAMRMSTL